MADRSRIGFWVVHRITWNAGELGSEIGWDQGDRTVAKSTEKNIVQKKESLGGHDATAAAAWC